MVSRRRWSSYRGNRYSVPPELASATVSVHPRASAADVIDIVTAAGQITIARHRLAADGAGVDGPRPRPRRAPWSRPRWPRCHHRPAAPPQGTHPTGTGGPGRGRSAAHQHTWHSRSTPAHAIRCHDGHRPVRLRTRRPRKEHPAMTTTHHQPTRSPAPEHRRRRPASTSSCAAIWPCCKLHDAAEALPTVLDHASAEGTVDDRGAGATALHRSRRHRSPPTGRPAAVRLPAHPGHRWRTSTTTPPPASTAS